MAFMNPGITRGPLATAPVKQKSTEDELIEKQFAGMRESNVAQAKERERQGQLALSRNAAAAGGFGGAQQRISQDISKQAQEVASSQEAAIGAQEAGAKLQAHLFNKEFEENQKTNMINSLTALKNAGFLENKAAAHVRIANFLNRFGGVYEGTELPEAITGFTEPRKNIFGQTTHVNPPRKVM